MDVIKSDVNSVKGSELKVVETGDRSYNDEGDVTILLTKNEWHESSNAIEILVKFAQEQREKAKERETAILNSIDTLCKCIFLKKEKSKLKPQEEKRDIYNEMKNLTDNEFEDILDQIKNEKNNTPSDISINTLEELFCKDFDGFYKSDRRYKVESLSLSSIVNDYQLMYQDFLSINDRLIDGELKDLLLKHSNNRADVDFVYNKSIRRRNICCLFPFKSCNYKWDDYGEDYISLINQFNANKNDKLKLFCMLYNGIAGIIITGDTGDSGLDQYIWKYNNYNETSTTYSLSSLCEWYILVEMMKTGIFGNDKKLSKRKTYHYDKDVYSSSVVTSIISNIFDNDLTSFKKLVEYCVEDIKYNNDIKKLKDIYKLNDEMDESDGKGYYGVSFYVLNRLSYVLYHDLLCIDMKKDNELLFPKLQKFYAFLYHFGVYCHCYIHFRVRDPKETPKKEYSIKKKQYEGLIEI